MVEIHGITDVRQMGHSAMACHDDIYTLLHPADVFRYSIGAPGHSWTKVAMLEVGQSCPLPQRTLTVCVVSFRIYEQLIKLAHAVTVLASISEAMGSNSSLEDSCLD
jgi:hypothetical protein